jgi:hypothetical protein
MADGSIGSLTTYVLKPISSVKTNLPNTLPATLSQSTNVELSACRGEYEPASLLLRASGQDVGQITLLASDLEDSASGSSIASTNIDIRIVKPWYQGFHAWNEIGKSAPGNFQQALVPELLLKDDTLVRIDPSQSRNLVRVLRGKQWQEDVVNPKALAKREQILFAVKEFPVRDAPVLRPFTVGANSSKQVWITAHVPDDARSGTYQGTLEIRSNDIVISTVTMSLKVLPVDLVDPSVNYSIYYRAQLDSSRASIGSEYRNREQMLNELRDMRAHGIKSPTIYQSVLDPSALRAALQLRKDAGFAGGPLYSLGIQTTASFLGRTEEQQEQRLRQLLPELMRTAHHFGYTDTYVYGKDEARGPALAAQRRLWAIVHQLGAKVFVAGYSDAFPLVGDTLDLLVYAHQPDFREAQRWHLGGRRIFSYANPQSGPENPYLFRLNYGILLWANNFDGAMVYAYQHCFGSCWNDIDHPTYRDHNLTYPTADGVIPTLAWEGLREGIDDVRYLSTLEAAVARNTATETPAIAKAQAFLDGLKTSLRLKQGRVGKYNASMNLDLDSIRGIAVRHLEALAQDPR